MLKISSEVKFGNNVKNVDEWHKTANPWTITLKNKNKRMTIPFWTGSALGEPSTFDVLHCLISDANCVADGFEWFCDSLGYNKDSIKDMRLYKACVANRNKLQRFLGDEFNNLLGLEEDDIKKYCI